MIRITPRRMRNLAWAYHAFLAVAQLFIGLALVLAAFDEADQGLRLFTAAVAVVCVLTGFALATSAPNLDFAKRVGRVE